VVFSLFSRKPQPKGGARRSVAKAVSPVSQRETSAGAGGTSAAEPASLDFTGLGKLSESSSFGSGSFRIDDSVGALPAAIEEAVMQYANGQTDAASAALEDAVRHGDLGTWAERGWGMLFDLYQVNGRREAYESLALDYAARFEKSPPAWVEAAHEALGPVRTKGSGSHIELTGKISTKTLEPIKQFLRMAESSPMVRLDVARVEDADNAGCAVLLKALQMLKKKHREFALAGAEHLIPLLSRKIASGKRENEETWLLLLELYQRQGLHEAFEDTAVGYAVTFEVSPPSWEDVALHCAVLAPDTEAAPSEGLDYTLQGEVVAAGADAFANLLAFAGDKSEVAIDASRLLRMDFVSAGQLLNALAKLQTAGKHVLIFGVNNLIMGLFEIIGIGQMAEIHLRRG
jgi:anti-anti-sigma regulatory factor